MLDPEVKWLYHKFYKSPVTLLGPLEGEERDTGQKTHCGSDPEMNNNL